MSGVRLSNSSGSKATGRVSSEGGFQPPCQKKYCYKTVEAFFFIVSRIYHRKTASKIRITLHIQFG